MIEGLKIAEAKLNRQIQNIETWFHTALSYQVDPIKSQYFFLGKVVPDSL